MSLQTYCKESSIHGLQYISQGQLTGDRIIWFFLVAGMFGLAGWSIKEMDNDWRESPVVTSVDIHGVKSLFFPAVTICLPGIDFT